MRFLKYLLLSSMLTSCSGGLGFQESIDRKSFTLTGGTLFSQPTIVTTKEIHFDSGGVLGGDVILEGNIESVGRYSTHLVMSDTAGKMLVVLTHVENSGELLEGVQIERLRVLGTVERGKKGLPYIQAKSLNIIEKED